MQLFNTMTRSLETVTPLPWHQAEKMLGLYACGLTVYDFTHLGHLRKYSMDDVLVRTLRHAGFKVQFVQNVTDVGHLSSDADEGEDKLEKGAKKYGKTVWEVAQEFEAYFWRSMELMGNMRPDISCRATEHIEQQLAMVLELERQGFTYVIEGDGVYFDTSKFPEYGKLAKLKLDQQQPGARVSAEGKRQATDFALWKFERPGENRAMVWPSPWAERSFPGWHIECSAMACHYLGHQFEIHTGGIDHIPVHHTNEIAQAEAAYHESPFVKYWVHHNFLLVEGEKMSKSLGNFFTIDDVLERGMAPQALRLLFLMSHYRSELNFTWDNLAGAHKTWQKLRHWLLAQGVGSLAVSRPAPESKWQQQFVQALEEDLKTPEAMAIFWEVFKSRELDDAAKLQHLLFFDEYLGLGLSRVSQAETKVAGEGPVAVADAPEAVQQLVAERAVARADQDWATADKLRQQLLQAGFEVVDQSDGSQTLRVV